MKTRLTWLLILMLALSAFWGCSDDDGPVIPTETAFEVMAAAGAAYINDSAQCPGVFSAASLEANLDLYTVLDVRSEADYLDGHIPGAYHVTFGNVLDQLANVIPTGKPYVVTCYTGQSAGHFKIAMELAGYGDVHSLLFGMSAWNTMAEGMDKWTPNIGNALITPETANNNGDLTTHDMPTLSEGTTTVVADRVNAMLAGGFKGITYTSVEANPENYFIINYFGEADYLGAGESGVPGHIGGAYQFTPYASMGIEEMLPNIPTDMPVVVYCWTGQHSSQVTAYLNMLGYDAYSLKFGSNGLFYDDLTAHKWSAGAQNEFALEMGPTMTGDFATLVEAGSEYINDATDCPGYIFAQDLYDNLDLYTVIDIRSQEHFDAGHIDGAYNTTLADLLTAVGTTIPADKAFAIACYTGQTASYAKFLMEMAGYEDSKFLFMGMSTWSLDVEGTSWATTDMVANLLGNPETTNNNDDLVWNTYPSTTGTVAERINVVAADGFQTITYASIEDHLGNYFIINYFGEADYEGSGSQGVPGHIPGAYQFNPRASLGMGQMLGKLPTDMTIVVYCWTGQHGAQVTAYLNMLGYDAKSMVYGSNNLFHDLLADSFKKWDPSFVMDFPLVGTPALVMN